MKEYIIETVLYNKRVNPRRIKAKSIDSLRLRLIKEGVIAKGRPIAVYTTNAKNVKPDTSFKEIGGIWYDDINQDYYWVDQAHIVKWVSPKSGRLTMKYYHWLNG